jgi:hypothetical protein
VTSSRRAARTRRPHLDETAPTPAATEPAVPAAPVPLAGLARAVESATSEVMGGEAVPGGVEEAIRRRSGGGHALPRRTAQELGASLGTDLSGVRVHADGEADTIARSVQAKAFTLGTDVYFSKGTYSPDSREGRSLLAHELTHVRQHQHGAPGGGSGGLRVGRVDDPAEREAEQVARQVVEGRPVSPGAAGGAGAVRRSADPTIRRLFGIFGATQVANLRENQDIGSEDEGLPLEFIDLADTLQAIPQLKDAEGLKFDGKAFDSATTFAGSEGMKGFGSAMSFVGGAKEMVGGAMEGKDAIENLVHGYRGYDFGLGATPGRKADSLSKNLGAVQAESALTSLFTGGLGITSGGSSLAGMSEVAGEQIPFLDVAVNGVQGTLKTKKAIEDSVASAKLGRQRTHIKREQDQFLPFELRAKRFGEFVVALRDGGRVKGDDRKRWTKVHTEWITYVSGLPADKQALYDLTAPDASATAKKKPKPPTGGSTGGSTGGGPGPATTFHPLLSDWNALTVQTDEKKAFLDFLQSRGYKDFGYGTDLRKDYEKSLKAPDGKRTESTDAGYEQMRDLGKLSSFGQRRKAETATVNSVEAVGHFADAAGTFTAGGDMGATKATGKAIKAASALYKSVKTLIKRGRRVHKLRLAKNQMEYGGKSGRGVLWGAKQFFGGNVDSQQKKARGALNSAVKVGDEHEKAHARITQVWKDAKDLYAAYLLDKADHDEYVAFCARNGADLTEALRLWPVPDVVADPGPAPAKAPAPTTGQKAPNTKAAKVMSAEDAKPLIKMLTIQCKRKVDDLIACLLSENETVRKRAKKILHIIAETNLAGGIQKIDDGDLDLLFEVHKKLRADATYGSNVKHQAEFKRRKGVIKETVSGQLEGIGG